MVGVSIAVGVASATAAAAAATKASSPGLSAARTRPGLVQNSPEPRVSEPTNAAPSSARAFGNGKTGLIELISAYTGIGSGRAAAARTIADPPERDPVKPTAL